MRQIMGEVGRLSPWKTLEKAGEIGERTNTRSDVEGLASPGYGKALLSLRPSRSCEEKSRDESNRGSESRS